MSLSEIEREQHDCSKKEEKTMKNKIIVAFVITLLLTSTLTIVSAEVSEELEAEIVASIDSGIAYLASQQNPSGYWGSGDRTAAYTAFVLIKLQDYAYEKGFDPFDPSYAYYDEVLTGYNYLWSVAHKLPIGMQTGGDPDTNGDGYGISFGPNSHRWIYSTGIVLMALESSRTPSRASGLDYDMDGDPDSFFDVAQNAADWLFYVQGDPAHGLNNGGWSYSGDASGQPTYYDYGGGIITDNSNTGFAVLGLAAAEGFGCTVPQWVKDAHSLWIDVIQIDVTASTYSGGSYYRPNYILHVNEYKAGNLLFEMTFVGDTPDATRFQDAMDFIVRWWDNTDPNIGWKGYTPNPGYPPYIAMYTLMKGFEYSGVELIDLDGDDVAEHDWFAEFAQRIVDTQYPGGYWSGGDGWGDSVVDTCFALLVLEKISPNIPPTAAFTASPNPVNAGSVVTFTDASYDDDGEIVSWSWDFGDTGISTEQNPTHTYSTVGVYPVTLTVTDDEGATGTATLTVEVTNAPPVADFTMPPQPYNEGDTVQFTDLSTDSDGVIVAWNWVFSDGGTSTDQNPTHSYLEDGEYTVDLTVTDDDGATDSTYRKVVVMNVAPTVDAGPDQTVRIDSLVDFLGSFTDPGVLDTHTIEWEFGDGTTDSGSLSTSHTYTASGTYVVKLTVTDDDGGVGSDKLIVTVISPKTMKKEAISILESHLGLYDKHIEHDIEQAIWHIEKSMEPELWVDETHITWQHGNKVFDEEKLAVKELLHIVEWKDAPSDAVDMAYTVIDILVEADEWLAQVQYDEATDYAGAHKQVDHQLELAEEEFANAADELLTMKKGHPKYDDAINAYNKAWQHAGLAIQHATK